MKEFNDTMSRLIELLGITATVKLYCDTINELTVEDIHKNIPDDIDLQELASLANESLPIELQKEAKDHCWDMLKENSQDLKDPKYQEDDYFYYYCYSNRLHYIFDVLLKIYFQNIATILNGINTEQILSASNESLKNDLNLLLALVDYNKLNYDEKDSIQFNGSSLNPSPFQMKNYEAERIFYLKQNTFNFSSNSDRLKPNHFFIRHRSIFQIIFEMTNNGSEFHSLNNDMVLKIFSYTDNNLFPLLKNLKLNNEFESISIKHMRENTEEITNTEHRYLNQLKHILFANIICALRANSKLIDIPCRIAMLTNIYTINKDLFNFNFSKEFDIFIERHKSLHKTYIVDLPTRQKMYDRALSMKPLISYKYNTLGTEHFSYALGINDTLDKPKAGRSKSRNKFKD